MEGFKNTTRMKTFGDVAPQAYAKGGSVKPMVKVAAKAPAKAKDCAPMKKAGGGDVSKMTRDQRMASMEKSSRAMTPAETRSMQAIKTAKAAAPKQGPLIKPARQMTPAERRMNEMDRPTNSRGAEAYKGGGKVGGSKVPFAVKKVMRKAEGGAVTAPQAMTSVMPTQTQAERDAMAAQKAAFDAQYNTPEAIAASQKAQAESLAMQQRWAASDAGRTNGTSGGGTFTADGTYVPNPQGTSPGPSPEMPQEPTPQSVFGTTKLSPLDPYGTSPGPMPTMPNEPVMPMPKPAYGGFDEGLMPNLPQPQFYDYVYTPKNSPEMFAADRARVAAAQAAQADRAATLQAQQEMAAQAQMDQGLGRGLAPMYGRGAPPRFMR